MFKKILVICAVGMTFFNNTIFAAEQETNQQIMLPITAGTITFLVQDLVLRLMFPQRRNIRG